MKPKPIEHLEKTCICQMKKIDYSLVHTLDKFMIYRGVEVIVSPMYIGEEGFWFNTINIFEKIKILQREIKMYKSLLLLYKNKQYLPSTFKVYIEGSTKELRELKRFIYSRNYTHQNDEDTSTWD